MDWVVKEVGMKMKLKYKSEFLIIVEEHLVLYFWFEVNCGAVYKGSLWFIPGQFLVMEAWKPDFILERCYHENGGLDVASRDAHRILNAIDNPGHHGGGRQAAGHE